MQTLEHVTITNGSATVECRDDCSDGMISWARDRLAHGDEDGGWSVKIIPGLAGCYRFDLLHKAQRIAICILCADEALHEEAWDLAKSLPSLPGVRLHPPKQVPWLAVALDPASLHPMPSTEVVMEAGEIQQYIAWALLE